MHALRSPLHVAQAPNLARAGALSGALTVNLLVLGALLLPLVIDTPLPRMQLPTPVPPAIEVTMTPSAQPLPQPAPLPLPLIDIAPSPFVVPDAIFTIPEPPPIHFTQTENVVPPAIDHVPAPSMPGLAEPGPADVTLDYITAPAPLYPRTAERNGWEGLVLLRVRVGTDGYPITVEIARSSGRAVLDQSARRKVLQHWRFRPAIRDGVAVEAIGQVPISFALHQR